MRSLGEGNPPVTIVGVFLLIEVGLYRISFWVSMDTQVQARLKVGFQDQVY